MPNLPHAGHGSNPPWAKKHLASRRNSGYNVKLYKIIKAIPHNSKCRYGERGAAAAGAVLKPQGGNCAVLPRISPDQTKSAQPRRQAGAARLCAKAKSLLFFLCFCLRNQNGVRSFCTADPVVLAPCLDGSDYSILPKFCKHFLSASGKFFPPIALFY